MNTEELNKRLLAEGCKSFYIPPWRHEGVVAAETVGVDVLENINGIWTIYFTERGHIQPPIYESSSEEDACDYYFKRITSFEHRHIVGSYEDEQKAVKLQEALKNAGIHSGRSDTVPYRTGRPPLKRVFVVGKDIFKVRALYSDLPLKDFEY